METDSKRTTQTQKDIDSKDKSEGSSFFYDSLTDDEKEQYFSSIGIVEVKKEENEVEEKVKKEKKETKRLTKKEKAKATRKKDKFFILRMFIMTLVLSIVFSLVTELVLSNGNLILSFLILVFLIFLSILFDIIGTAAASCDIQPFISKASRKVKTGVVAMNLLKNAEKVASFCNDVVGDICGIVSGGCASTIVLVLATKGETQVILLSVLFSAVVSAITVGGKAVGKLIAIRGSERIINIVANVVGVFKK